MSSEMQEVNFDDMSDDESTKKTVRTIQTAKPPSKDNMDATLMSVANRIEQQVLSEKVHQSGPKRAALVVGGESIDVDRAKRYILQSSLDPVIAQALGFVQKPAEQKYSTATVTDDYDMDDYQARWNKVEQLRRSKA